jgi:PBSX family phage terminase large subunit
MPLSDKQEQSLLEALDGPENVLIWEGAVRSGKTMSSILAWCEYVRSQAPAGPLVMIGKTKDTLRRNVLDEIDAYFGDSSPLAHTAGANVGTLFGRKVHMIGANDAKAESRIRGLTLAGAYVDEGTLLPSESFWSMLLTRHATTFGDGAKVFVTTNPDSPAHWFKRKVIDRAATLNARVWKFVLDDNPILTTEAKDQLRRSLTGLFYKRFIEGLWVAAEGAIYDMLDLDTRHRVTWDQLPTLTGDYWLGVDYGDLNPFHAVLIALGVDRVLYVVGEWRYSGREKQRQMEQTEYEHELRTWLEQGAGVKFPDPDHPGRLLVAENIAPYRVAVDPSAAGFRNVLSRRGWTGLTSSDDKINPVRDGIRNVASLLGLVRLRFVEGAAPHLEREMQGYTWDEKAAARGEDTPVKVDDHGPDALRYAVASARATWAPWITATKAA